MRMTEAQRKEWNDMKGGNSLCVCGKCGKFTWVGWTPEAEAFLQRGRK